MTHRAWVRAFVGLMSVTLATLMGCGGRSEGYATDTKTNWLASCNGDDECDDGFACLCGVCTIGCGANAACASLDERAACLHAECEGGDGVCALPETKLESHASEFDDCPRRAQDYVNARALCAETVLDCASEWVRFDDECGCGCEQGPECDPEATYVGSGTECGLLDYVCAAGEEHFTDECGCGCRPSNDAGPTCTQPADSYIADAQRCANTDFDLECAPGVWFSDDCGCGCTSPTCDETVEYAAFGERCEVVDFDCGEGEERVTDDCGCGCRPFDESACPRAPDEYSALGGACDIVLIECEQPNVYFRDECGCGCGPNLACDDNVDYVAYGACEIAEGSCELGQTEVVDACGCGCKLNPACNPDARYVGRAGCISGFYQCEPGEQYYGDECGCGCIAVDDSEDGGGIGCDKPEGAELETEILLQTRCTQAGVENQIVTSREQLDAALAQCAPEVAYEVAYDGQPLYLEVVPTSTQAQHIYTIQADDGIRLGLQQPAFCEATALPYPLFIFKLQGLTADSSVTAEPCTIGACSE